MKQPKPKRCKICKNEFIPKSSTAIVCSFSCALEYTEQQRVKKEAKNAKQERQERIEAIKKLRTRGWYVNEAQKAVNAYIVKGRDFGKPCVSCGKHKPRYDCGHYLARSTHPELRFEEDNLANQCIYCNNYSKNAHHAYRKGLIERIGIERVLALEAPHEPAKWTIPELEAIRKEYKNKLKELKQ